MLTQNGGTLEAPADLGNYTDPKHYRLPQPDGARVVYGLATFTSSASVHHLLAFASCRRFNGAIHVRPASMQIVIEGEGLTLERGESWELEEFIYTSGNSRTALLDALGERLAANHPPLITFKTPPAGLVLVVLLWPPRHRAAGPRQPGRHRETAFPGSSTSRSTMGISPQWETGSRPARAFGGAVQTVLRQIRQRGFEPAIWVAPFIAEAGSNLFKQHPDWFVKDQDGSPLRADTVTFGGWRRGPWYALDGTHPGARAHLEHVFDTMRREWGCTYFKLDANFWGAIHGGRFHDPKATRIEAYRRGMGAVRARRGRRIHSRLQPSDLGVARIDPWFPQLERHQARMEAHRNHGPSEPDAQLAERTALVERSGRHRPYRHAARERYRFHATAIYATGGMILSGDDLTTIPEPRLAMLRQLDPPTGVAARFNDDSLEVGTVELTDRRVICLLNWGESPRELSFDLQHPHTVVEAWSGETLGTKEKRGSVALGPRDGKLLVCTPA